MGKAKLGVLALAACLAVAPASLLGAGESGGTAGTEAEPAYRIRPGDRLQVWVYQHADLNLSLKVAPDGFVRFPFVGRLQAAGRTEEELSRRLAEDERLRRMIAGPQVLVSVTEFAPASVYIFGEVRQPQKISLEVGVPLTLSQAIAQAGGCTARADRLRVKLFRGSGGEARKTHTINLMELVGHRNLQGDVVLQAGDRIYVPAGGGVFVLGGVNAPGYYAVSEFDLAAGQELTATQALAAAGGLKPQAAAEEVQVLRRDPDAPDQPPRLVKVNLEGLATGTLVQDDLKLAAGDVVYVPLRRKIFVLGAVNNPGAYDDVQGQKLTVTKLISLAGGFDKWSKKSAVRVYRQGQSGPERIRTVDVAAVLESGDLAQDFALEPGDIVFVPQSAW